MRKYRNICVIGLGYVGLPLAVEFSKKYNVVGFDKNKFRINQLKRGLDLNSQITKKDIKKKNLNFTFKKKRD